MTKKMQQHVMLLVLIAAGIGYAYHAFLYAPLKAKRAASLETLQATEAKVAEMKRRAFELPKLQAEMKLLEAQVTELEKLLPREKEIPQLLRSVTRTAQKYQIRIIQFVPQAVVSQGNYNELPFQVTMVGNYHGIALFLADLGQGTRIMSARNVVFAQVPPVKDSTATVNATFTLVAYTFKG